MSTQEDSIPFKLEGHTVGNPIFMDVWFLLRGVVLSVITAPTPVTGIEWCAFHLKPMVSLNAQVDWMKLIKSYRAGVLISQRRCLWHRLRWKDYFRLRTEGIQCRGGRWFLYLAEPLRLGEQRPSTHTKAGILRSCKLKTKEDTVGFAYQTKRTVF